MSGLEQLTEDGDPDHDGELHGDDRVRFGGGGGTTVDAESDGGWLEEDDIEDF